MGKILMFESWSSSRLEESSNVEVTDPVSPDAIVPASVTTSTVETNKEILDQIKSKGIFSGKIPNLPSVNDKNFLKGVLNGLDTGKAKPVLFIPKSSSPGTPSDVQLNIPGYNLSFTLKKDYFGTNIPLPKVINLQLGYEGTGGGNLSLDKVRAGVQIPIGR